MTFLFQQYLEGTLRAITEAKEDILLEIEAKLTKYAEVKNQKKYPV